MGNVHGIATVGQPRDEVRATDNRLLSVAPAVSVRLLRKGTVITCPRPRRGPRATMAASPEFAAAAVDHIIAGLLGHDRAAMLAAILPASSAEQGQRNRPQRPSSRDRGRVGMGGPSAVGSLPDSVSGAGSASG